MRKQINIIKTFSILLLIVLQQSTISAQQTVVDSSLLDRVSELEKQVSYKKPGEDHFMVAGLMTTGFVASKTTTTTAGVSATTKSNSFPDADNFEFSPMMIWRHGNKFLMEFEPSFTVAGNSASIGVNWADVSYFAAPGLIIRAGYFVLPFGTYAKREAAGWINKLAPDPMGIADMTPTDFGVEAEGGFALGSSKMNYDVALTNGNQLNSDGTLTSGNSIDNNNNKTVTARVGFLPFSNSSLELGVSGMFGKVGNQSDPLQNNMARLYAFDLNYVKNLNPILLNIKSQYNIQNIDNANYINPNDSSSYSFNNHTTAFFVQGSIRPTGASGFIKNLELAGRYTSYNLPANSANGTNQHTVTFGLDYWLTWRTVFKITYEIYNGSNTANKEVAIGIPDATKSNTLYVQFSIQL